MEPEMHDDKPPPLPAGVTEEMFAKAYREAASNLRTKYRFAYHDEDDIDQMVWLIVRTKIAKYDPARASGSTPEKRLANWMFVTARNKLMNNKRDQFHRADPPCKQCSTGEYCTPGGCRHFVEWRDRNASKSSLAQAAAGGGSGDTGTHFDRIDGELLQLVKDRLPQEMRSDLLRLLAGARFPKLRRQRLYAAVQGILGELKWQD